MAEAITELTVGQSLISLGLDADPFQSAAKAGDWWSFQIFGMKLFCYNFVWRRKALAFHDLHHVVTGYPCTLRGEMQVATWEFAAGAYPSIFAKLFCLPLVALGALLIPQKIYAAYCKGKCSKSLFTLSLDSKITTMSVDKLTTMTRNENSKSAPLSDRLECTALIVASLMLYLLPVLLLWLAYLHFHS
jgi:hypothetical protein